MLTMVTEITISPYYPLKMEGIQKYNSPECGWI
jgi:hypothetical protein